MDDLTLHNACLGKQNFENIVNENNNWVCHCKETPKANKPCCVIVFEVEPFVGLNYQMYVAQYDPIGDNYVDIINEMRILVDSPVCTYWKYLR